MFHPAPRRSIETHIRTQWLTQKSFQNKIEVYANGVFARFQRTDLAYKTIHLSI